MDQDNTSHDFPQEPPRITKKLLYILVSLLVITTGISSYHFFIFKKTQSNVTPKPPTDQEIIQTDTPLETDFSPTNIQKGNYFNKDLGINLKHPDNWQLIKEDSQTTIWNIMSGSKVIGTVILKKSQVLGDNTYTNSEQQSKTTVGQLEGDKKISVIGKTSINSFSFDKDIDGKLEKVIIELSVPDQDTIGSQVASELHLNFDQVIESISIPVQTNLPDQTNSSLSLSKQKIKSDGNDYSVLTVNLRDSQKNILSNVYLDIIPEDSSDLGFNQIIPKSSIPSQRTNSAATILGDNVYVAGGKNYNDVLSIVEIYNLTSNTWNGANSLTGQRTEFTLDQVNGNLYAIGGHKGLFSESNWDQSFIDRVDMYEPDESRWITKASLPQGLKAHASATINNKIYLFTGMSAHIIQECGDNQGYSTLVYDTVLDTWSTSNPKVICGSSMLSATIDNKVYLFGGHHDAPFQKDPQNATFILSDLNIYDTETNQWKKGASLPHPRERGGVGVINGKIYLIGGFKSFGGQIGEEYNQYVDVYDPQSDSWTTMGEFYPAPIDFSYVTYNNKIYTFGGEHLYSWPYRNSVFEFTPLMTSREPSVNPSNQSGDAQFIFRSLFPGTRSYKVVAYNTDGSQIEIGKISMTFE